MKNIFVAAIFLFSQLGFTAEKAILQKPKNFQIENLTFSELFLTKDEIIHLSTEDQLKYIYAMIALGQIVEGSQRFQMGYEDNILPSTAAVEAKENLLQKYSEIFHSLVSNANAWGFLGQVAVRVGGWAMPALSRAGTWVAEGAAGFLERHAANTTAKAAGQMSLDFAGTAALKSAKVANDAAWSMVKSATKKTISNLNAADKVMREAIQKKGLAGAEAEIKAFQEIERGALRSNKAAFMAAGGEEAAFNGFLKESGLKKLFANVWNNKGKLVLGGLAFHGADSILKDSVGSTSLELLENAMVDVGHWFSGPGLSGPVMLTPEQMANGDSKQEKGKTCIFGGISSIWTEFDSGVLRCTRPKEANNANCKLEDGLFQCPSHGMKLANSSIEKELCIKTPSLNDLTVRCTKTLKTLLETKLASMDSEEAAKSLHKNYQEVIVGLEARDRMRNEKGETKSIQEYCLAKSVTQTKECGIITETLALLKSTNVVEIYKARSKATAAAPAAPEPAADAPKTEPTGLEAGEGPTKK